MRVAPRPSVAPVPTGVRRLGLLSVHTSPLAQPGTGDGGGLNVYVSEVGRRLAARGIHVDVFTRATDPVEPETVEVIPNFEVHRIVAGPVAELPKAELANHLCSFVMGMLRHPRAGSHDLLHGHYWLSGWVGRRLSERWGIPLVQTFHTLGVMKNASLAPGDRPEPPLRLAAEERIARSADRIVVLTCGEARLLHRSFGLSGRSLDVVPAGVDLELFRPDGPAAAPAASGRPLLLFVGRLQPLKGPDVAIETLAAVRRSLPDAELLVVGGTSGNGAGRSDPERLRSLAAELGVADAVHLLPARPQGELAALYRAADLVLAPSRSETFGLVALEAQASGTPVVAADVDGLAATVGDGGVLVRGHDPEDHAAAVTTLVRDRQRYAAMRDAGLRHGARSSWDATVDRLLAVYGDLVRVPAAVRSAS